MAISNYGELKTQLTTILAHSRFVSTYDNATIKFERVCNRKLRTRNQETSTTLTTASGSVSLPSDYLKWRAIEWTGRTPNVILDYVHPAYFTTTTAGTDPGDPRIFTIEGSTLKIFPQDNVASRFTFHYYQKLTSLITNPASDANTNWLLTDHPDAYEYGVLVELFAQARNREAAELYKLRRDEVLAEIIQLSALTTNPSSALVRQSGEYF